MAATVTGDTALAPPSLSARKSYTIAPADLSSPTLAALIATHTAQVTDPATNLPGEKTYALDLTGLTKPDIALFCCWEEAEADDEDDEDAAAAAAAAAASGTRPARLATSSAELERRGAVLVGCAALRVYRPRDYPHASGEPDALEGEVKTMHTLASRRGNGLGRMLVDRLVEEARARGVRTLRLETGATPGFAGVRLFYERCGFKECGVFAGYTLQANSMFMERRI